MRGVFLGVCVFISVVFVVIFFEKVKLFFFGEKLSVCGIVDGGEKFLLDDKFEYLEVVLFWFFFIGEILYEEKKEIFLRKFS